MVPWYALAAIAVAVIALIAISYFIRRSPAVERGMVLARLTLALSVLYVVGTAVGTVVATIRDLVEKDIPVSLPVGPYWPTLPPQVTFIDGPTAQVVGGGLSHADVLVSGLGTTARLWLAAGEFSQGAAFATIGVAVAVLSHRLIRKDPFRATVALATTVSAFAIGIGGVAWQVCATIGGMMASREVLEVTAWQIEGSPTDSTDLADFGWPPVAAGFQIDFWPIMIGLALGALALVFRSGARLQRETEQLRRDTAGLI